MAGDRLTDGSTVRVTDRDDKHFNKLATVIPLTVTNRAFLRYRKRNL